jgi:hypothetical protein
MSAHCSRWRMVAAKKKMMMIAKFRSVSIPWSSQTAYRPVDALHLAQSLVRVRQSQRGGRRGAQARRLDIGRTAWWRVREGRFNVEIQLPSILGTCAVESELAGATRLG